MTKSNSVVRLQSHQNRTPTGRPSATATRKLAHYLAYGRGRPQVQAQQPQRGRWYTEKGKTPTHKAVLEWVQSQGKTHPYTYQLLLSVNEADLAAGDYLQAMRAGGELFLEWRLIAHRDTDHSHAHVLAFGEKEMQITGRPFRSWWQAVRQALAFRQELTLAAEQQEPNLGLEKTEPSHQLQAISQTQDWGMEV